MKTCVHYLNLPKIPDELEKLAVDVLSQNENMNLNELDNYKWTEASKTELSKWCYHNISPSLYWGVQVMSGDLGWHWDEPTTVKITYIFQTGGNNVETVFYDTLCKTVLQSIIIEPKRWHILNVKEMHTVRGIQPGKLRISLTGRIF
jgi:hypothetical protein